MEPSEPKEEKNAKTEKNALVINIQSWATPIIGLAMLLVGLLGGYFLRPLITGAKPAAPQAAAQPQSTSVAVNPGVQPTQAIPNAIPAEAIAPILSLTQHYLGSADAPITLIEFSDFQ